ncbi:hypothetical protein [Paracoccus sp. (in: a-proteobacteria)]|uniref:hypothetical protein n=1 Tax=Paracoccus sp. TaxID=267 RepID=UPI00396C3F16
MPQSQHSTSQTTQAGGPDADKGLPAVVVVRAGMRVEAERIERWDSRFDEELKGRVSFLLRHDNSVAMDIVEGGVDRADIRGVVLHRFLFLICRVGRAWSHSRFSTHRHACFPSKNACGQPCR